MPYRANSMRLTDDVYVELVSSLFTTLLPTSIIGTTFTIVGIALVAVTGDVALVMLLAAGIVAAAARLTVLLLFRNDRAWHTADAVRAGGAERWYAYCYFAFSIAFGAFTARGFVVAPVDARVLLVGLVFGYGAGVAAGVALRPWISVPSMIIGVVPLIVASTLVESDWDFALGLLTAIFLAGGIESILRRYRKTARLLSVERMLQRTPRKDEITGLPNEIELRQHFSAIVAERAVGRKIALHLVRVEGLGDVDRRFGYGVCASTLRAVAVRLRQSVASDDLVARMGGDIFAVLQTNVDDAADALQLSATMRATLSRRYDDVAPSLNIHVLTGYAVDTHRHAAIDMMLERAAQSITT